jgi:hypothetical protein
LTPSFSQGGGVDAPPPYGRPCTVYRGAVIDVKSKDRHLVLSRVNVKSKCQKSYHLPGGYDVGRLSDENLRETFLELLNTKLKNLKSDNIENRWNNFRKNISIK